MSILLGHQGVGSGAQCGDFQPPHPVGIRRYRTVENLTRRRIVNPHRNGPRRSGDTDIDVFEAGLGQSAKPPSGRGVSPPVTVTRNCDSTEAPVPGLQEIVTAALPAATGTICKLP